MLQRKDSRSFSPAFFAALVLLAAACGGAVMASNNDGGPDAAATAPVLYDAAGEPVGLEADSAMNSAPIGSSGGDRSSSSSGSSGASNSSGASGSSGGRSSGGGNSSSGGPLERDSGGDDAQSDASACSPVLASDYDQSCDADTDCIGVGQVSQCPASACDGCLTQAVNRAAAAQYMAALSRAFASEPAGVGCACPCEALAICRGGRCEYGFCGPPSTDTLPACADAGGRCSYAANTTCDTAGPPNSCAYADETCCL